MLAAYRRSRSFRSRCCSCYRQFERSTRCPLTPLSARIIFVPARACDEGGSIKPVDLFVRRSVSEFVRRRNHEYTGCALDPFPRLRTPCEHLARLKILHRLIELAQLPVDLGLFPLELPRTTDVPEERVAIVV